MGSKYSPFGRVFVLRWRRPLTSESDNDANPSQPELAARTTLPHGISLSAATHPYLLRLKQISPKGLYDDRSVQTASMSFSRFMVGKADSCSSAPLQPQALPGQPGSGFSVLVELDTDAGGTSAIPTPPTPKPVLEPSFQDRTPFLHSLPTGSARKGTTYRSWHRGELRPC
jgi:hypothetical protein